MNMHGRGIGRIGMLAAIIAVASVLPTSGTSSTDNTMVLENHATATPDQLGLKLLPERGVAPAVVSLAITRLSRGESVELIATLKALGFGRQLPALAVRQHFAPVTVAAAIYQPPSYASLRSTTLRNSNTARSHLMIDRLTRPSGAVRWFSNPTPGRSTIRYG